MNDETADDERNNTFYKTLLLRHGDSHQSLNWGSALSQQQRFKVLAEVGINAGESILDVGCGLGDYYAWLKTHYSGINYTGLDLTPAMVDRAQKRFPEVEFFKGTILESSNLMGMSFDHLMASGIFCLRQYEPEKYLERTICEMFSRAKKSVAFNTLSSWTSEKDDREYYADPLRLIEFCRSLTPWVTMRHDYHARDFTIYMYKNKTS